MARQSSQGDYSNPTPYQFPRWANLIVPAVLVAVFGGLPYMVVLVGFGAAPSTTDVGYQPHQPIPYSHELHVNQLGMDCRYCHTTVEKAAFAAIPPSAVCMNCHHAIRKDSPNLRELYATFKDGMPVEWVKVHDLPDYAQFNHSAHINKGVSCVSCHGRVDRMGAEGVYQHEPLSMGWCLTCHRDPAPNLRPADQVTNLMWGLDRTEEQKRTEGAKLWEAIAVRGLPAEQAASLTPEQVKELAKHRLNRLQDCSTCHR